MAKVLIARKTEKRRVFSTKKIVYTALLTALVAVMSQISVPLPSGIPVTLQTFAVAFCGYFGGIFGVFAVLFYLLLGLVGAPVFANFKGGFSAFVGLTGGYLVGFLLMATLCALPIRSSRTSVRILLKTILGIVGLALCHLTGALWFGFVSGNGFERAFLVASAPYLAKDLLSVVGGYLLVEVLKKRKITLESPV